MKDLADYFTGVETDVRLFMLIILLPLVLINYVSHFTSTYDLHVDYLTFNLFSSSFIRFGIWNIWPRFRVSQMWPQSFRLPSFGITFSVSHWQWRANNPSAIWENSHCSSALYYSHWKLLVLWVLFLANIREKEFKTNFFVQIMPLENEMKTPKAFGGSTGVLNKSMFMIVILYTCMGLLGYLKYGADSKGSITLNLPSNEL